MNIRSKKYRLLILLAVAACICITTVTTVRVKQQMSLPRSLDAASIDLSGVYNVQEVSGFNNRGSFTGMPLDQLDKRSTIIVSQRIDSIEIEYTDRKNRKRKDQIKRIGSFGSRWVWTSSGIAGTGLPVRIFNIFMLPGLVYYNQSGSLKQTPSGLTLSYSWAEGGVILWLVPWKDAPQKTTIILTKEKIEQAPAGDSYLAPEE